MRCSCKVCGPEVWMVQAESSALGCVCTECGYRCTDCPMIPQILEHIVNNGGKNFLYTHRDRVAALAGDPRFSPERLQALFEDPEGEDYPEEQDFPEDLRRENW